MALVRAMKRNKKKSPNSGTSKSVTRSPSPKAEESGGLDAHSGVEDLNGSLFPGHVTQVEKLV